MQEPTSSEDFAVSEHDKNFEFCCSICLVVRTASYCLRAIISRNVDSASFCLMFLMQSKKLLILVFRDAT